MEGSFALILACSPKNLAGNKKADAVERPEIKRSTASAYSATSLPRRRELLSV